MARFDDFDQHLEEEIKRRQHMITTLQAAKQDYDPLISTMFAILEEYYRAVLNPRKKLMVVLKKKESLTLDDLEKPPTEPLFTYRVNLIPRDLVPVAYNPKHVPKNSYLTPLELTDHDWHPSVAMQYDLSLFPTVNEKNKPNGQLQPFISFQAWGTLDEEDEGLLPKGVTITKHPSWGLAYTQATCNPRAYKLTDLDKTITRILMLLTPLVLKHW